MKIAVSSTGKKIEDIVDPRFGRCLYFIIVDVEKNKIKDFETVENEGVDSMGGAGVRATELVAGKGAKVIISGNIGPNAFGALSRIGIKTVTGVGGISVKEAVERYLNGELKETKEPTTGIISAGK